MRAKRVDESQPAIVEALRKIGVRVEHTHMVGGGFPDLLLSTHHGETMLMEIKEPGEGLKKNQVEFIAEWYGKVLVAHSPTEAIDLVTAEMIEAENKKRMLYGKRCQNCGDVEWKTCKSSGCIL